MRILTDVMTYYEEWSIMLYYDNYSFEMVNFDDIKDLPQNKQHFVFEHFNDYSGKPNEEMLAYIDPKLIQAARLMSL